MALSKIVRASDTTASVVLSGGMRRMAALSPGPPVLAPQVNSSSPCSTRGLLDGLAAHVIGPALRVAQFHGQHQPMPAHVGDPVRPNQRRKTRFDVLAQTQPPVDQAVALNDTQGGQASRAGQRVAAEGRAVFARLPAVHQALSRGDARQRQAPADCLAENDDVRLDA